MAVQQTPDGRWFIIFRLPGEKHPVKEYFGRGADAKRQAQARDHEIKAAKKRGRIVRPTSGMHLDELAQLYLDDAKARGRSEYWRKEFARLLNGTILPALTGKPVDSLTGLDLLKLQAAWEGRSPATVNRYMGYLKAVFAFGVRHELTTKNPCQAFTKSRETARPMRLTVADLERIYAHAEDHLQWAIEVAFNLGARPGPTELFSLRWEDVDFQGGVVHIRGTKTMGSDRLVPIGADFHTRLALMRTRAKSPYVIEYEGRPVKQMFKSMRTAVRRAGITYQVRWYDIRHLCATAMLSGGADLVAVSKILGHHSTKMTADTYCHLLAGEKERAVAVLPKLGPKAGKVVRIR